MVHTDIGNTPDQPDLTPQDSQIADALSAWLAALEVAPPKQTFQDATNQCVSLCQCFTLFAPHLLSERDFFKPANVSGANVSRQRRYNTRRLARSLAAWFNLSPPPGAVSEKPPASPVQLAPAPQETIRALSDAASAEHTESQAVILTLAEVLLCASVHSQKREIFIKAVLTLSSLQQDALAQSIRRTTVEEQSISVLGPVPLNDENVIVAEAKSPESSREPSLEKLSEPSGIPLADYKALAAERDNLRRKLAASEFEKNKSAEVSDGLKVSLEEAADKIRKLQAEDERQQAELAARSSALQEAKNALRDAHVNAEEIDVLRAKAASAEQLEASLKRASKRLEEVAEMRKSTKDLEAQISAFRENEERMAKHAEYLESQLANSNERAQQLATLSDNLSAEVEKKEQKVSDLKKDNDDLRNKLETTNQQLTSMLLQSTNTMSQSKGTSSKSAETETQSKLQGKESKGNETVDAVADKTSGNISTPSEAISQPLKPETIKEMASDTLYDEIGVRMQWGDIVECVRGVIDALREMDEMEAGQNGAVFRTSSQDVSQMSHPPADDQDIAHSSSHSLRSEADSHNPDIGSDSESRMSLLPEFGELDSSLAAANGGKGDEFDYAANHVNVKEIPLDGSMGRRRSSQLAAIPENQEGFNASDSDPYDHGASYDSGYLTEGDEEPADETVNVAAIGTNRARIPGDVTDSNNPERKSSGSDSKNGSPNRPKSPFIVTDFLPSDSQMVESQVRSTPLCRCHSLTKDVRRSTSLTLSVRSGISRSPSHSETTRSLVRQARNELTALQKAVELMRTERKSSTSIGTLVQQLETARNELSASQEKLRDTESELNDTRKELTAIIKEMDSLTVQRKVERDREAKVLDEKERLLDHLSESLKQKESEVSTYREEIQRGLQAIETLKASEKSLEEKLQAASVIERAHELEITRLTTQVEASDMFTTRLNAVVNKSDGLHTQISRQRESHLNDIAESAKREKEIAEFARDEAKRVAQNHASVLEDVRASAAAAARRKSEVEVRIHTRKSTRFSDFWRRLLHREKVHIDYTMPASTTSLPVISERTPSERTPRKKTSIV